MHLVAARAVWCGAARGAARAPQAAGARRSCCACACTRTRRPVKAAARRRGANRRSDALSKQQRGGAAQTVAARVEGRDARADLHNRNAVGQKVPSSETRQPRRADAPRRPLELRRACRHVDHEVRAWMAARCKAASCGARGARRRRGRRVHEHADGRSAVNARHRGTRAWRTARRGSAAAARMR